MIEWEKQIIYLRFLGINQILLFHILRNLKRFPMKPDIRITTFLGIQIIRNHILKNLDIRSNMDSLVPNITYMRTPSSYITVDSIN